MSSATPLKISKGEARRYLIGAVSSWPQAPEGYVYVIRSKNGGPVKIGFSISPECRVYELQCGNPDEIAVVAAVAVAKVCGLVVERHCHKLARFAHVRREWFDLDTLEAVACVLTACVELGAKPLTLADCAEYSSGIRTLEHVASEGQRKRAMRARLGIE